MSSFKRENRYAVFKLKNLTDDQRQQLYDLQMELGPHNDVKECVVVEHDWPNYQDTWAAIEQVAAGSYGSPYQRIEDLENELAIAKQKIEVLPHLLGDSNSAANEGINLTAKQLREAAYWANPDNDPGQEETEVRIEWMPKRTAIDGEEMASGDYLYFIDYPEEGVIGPLGAEGFTGPEERKAAVVPEDFIKWLDAFVTVSDLSGIDDHEQAWTWPNPPTNPNFFEGYPQLTTGTLRALHSALTAMSPTEPNPCE